MSESPLFAENSRSDGENCVVVFAPFGQDGSLLAAMLSGAEIEVQSVSDVIQFARQLPQCAVGIVTTEALSPESVAYLQSALQSQPVWSDAPLVLLTAQYDIASYDFLTQSLGNVTILQRPLEAGSLLTIVRTALRARHKQYEVRGLIKALENSRNNLDFAVNNAQLGTFYCEFPLGKIIWNKTCKDHFYLPHDTEVDFDLFYARLHDEDREATREAVTRSITEHKQYNIEYRVVAPDGRMRWINAIGKTYYAENGDPVRFDGITIDITEKKARERILKFLVNINDATRELTEPLAIMQCVTRMLGEHLEVSRCAYAPVEADENHFTIFADYTDGCPSSTGSYTLDAFGTRAAKAIRAGQTLIIRNRDAEATPDDDLAAFRMIEIQAIICTALIKEGKLAAMMAVHNAAPRQWIQEEIDLVEMVAGRTWSIIERAQADKKLKDRAQEISALNARLQHSMTETHHRVKNNLQVVSAMIEMQMQEYETENAVPLEQYRQLKAHIHTLAIVHDLLTKSVKEEEDAQRVSAKAVLDKLLPMLQQTAWNQSIGFSVSEASLSSKQCIALALVLNELVSNALKHGDKKAEVTFRVEGECAVLEVCDDGDGFPESFDPRRAANMGLELVESLVRTDLRGKSRYETRHEGGGRVTVTFALPLCDE